jgi:hypothetical protein
MVLSKRTFIGIDPSGGRHPFTYAAIDEDCQLIGLAAGEIEDALAFLSGQQTIVLAVNAPRNPSDGLVRKNLEMQGLTAGRLRGADMRLAEYELHECGIAISPTPSRKEACAAWIQMGFDFFYKLDVMGFKPFPTDPEAYQWLETHPHAAYCVLLGQLPLPKPTLEGRLQRQLALYERGMGIRDPMGFFEEITRHRLLKSVLPMEIIYTSEELDALVAAYTAYLAFNQPNEVIWVGNKQEGQIVLPVSRLKETYS